MKILLESNESKLMIKNRQGWEIIFNRTSPDQFNFTLMDPWGIRHDGINDVIIAKQEGINIEAMQALSNEDRQVFMVDLLQQRIQKIIAENHKHGLMVDRHNGKLCLVFDNYGLAGGVGERLFGFVVGGAQVGAGIALIVFTGGAGAIGGSALLSSGINGCVLSVTAEDEDYSAGEFLKTSAIGAVTGVISGGVSAGVGAVGGNLLAKGTEKVGEEVVKKTGTALAKEFIVATSKAVVADGATGVVSTVLGTCAEAAIRGDASTLFGYGISLESPGEKPQKGVMYLKRSSSSEEGDESRIMCGNDAYIRHDVDGNGDCGYTAFGIARQQAHRLLRDNVLIVRDILKPIILETLLTNEEFIKSLPKSFKSVKRDFRNYFAALQRQAPDLIWFENALKKHADNQRLIEAHIDYDVQQKKIDGGWCHPLILFALAQIQRVHLRLYQIDANGMMIPHRQYPECHPKGAKDSAQLLFINGNHFERVERTQELAPKRALHNKLEYSLLSPKGELLSGSIKPTQLPSLAGLLQAELTHENVAPVLPDILRITNERKHTLEPRLTTKNILLGAASSVIGGQIGAVADKATKSGVAASFKLGNDGKQLTHVVASKTGRKVVNAVKGAVVGAASGGATSAASTMVSNYVNGEELTSGMKSAVITGASVGGLMGAAKAVKQRGDEKGRRRDEKNIKQQTQDNLDMQEEMRENNAEAERMSKLHKDLAEFKQLTAGSLTETSLERLTQIADQQQQYLAELRASNNALSRSVEDLRAELNQAATDTRKNAAQRRDKLQLKLQKKEQLLKTATQHFDEAFVIHKKTRELVAERQTHANSVTQSEEQSASLKKAQNELKMLSQESDKKSKEAAAIKAKTDAIEADSKQALAQAKMLEKQAADLKTQQAAAEKKLAEEKANVASLVAQQQQRDSENQMLAGVIDVAEKNRQAELQKAEDLASKVSGLIKKLGDLALPGAKKKIKKQINDAKREMQRAREAADEHLVAIDKARLKVQRNTEKAGHKAIEEGKRTVKNAENSLNKVNNELVKAKNKVDNHLKKVAKPVERLHNQAKKEFKNAQDQATAAAKIVETYAEKTVKGIQKAATEANDNLNKAGQQLDKVRKQVDSGVKQSLDSVKRTAKDLGKAGDKLAQDIDKGRLAVTKQTENMVKKAAKNAADLDKVGKCLASGLKDVGSDLSKAAKKAGKDVSSTAKKAGKDASNAAKTAGKDVSTAAKQAAKDTSSAVKKAGNDINKASNEGFKAIAHAHEQAYAALKDAVVKDLSNGLKDLAKNAKLKNFVDPLGKAVKLDKISAKSFKNAIKKAGGDISAEWKRLPPGVRTAIIVVAAGCVAWGAVTLFVAYGGSVSIIVSTTAGPINILTYSAAGVEVVPALVATAAAITTYQQTREQKDDFEKYRNSPHKDYKNRPNQNPKSENTGNDTKPTTPQKNPGSIPNKEGQKAPAPAPDKKNNKVEQNQKPPAKSEAPHPFDDSQIGPNDAMFAPEPPPIAPRKQKFESTWPEGKPKLEKPEAQANPFWDFKPNPDLPVMEEQEIQDIAKTNSGSAVGITDFPDDSGLDIVTQQSNGNINSRDRFFQPAPSLRPNMITAVGIIGVINDWLTFTDRAPAGLKEVMINNMIKQYGGCDAPALHQPGNNPDRICAYEKAAAARKEAARKGPEYAKKVNEWLAQLEARSRPKTKPVVAPNESSAR